MTYIRREFIEEFGDNTNRHELGIGLIGKCLGLRRKKKISADIQQQLDAIGAKTYRQVAHFHCYLSIAFDQLRHRFDDLSYTWSYIIKLLVIVRC